MKDSVTILLIGLCLFACQTEKVRYKTTSPEIDQLFKGIKAYENAEWEIWLNQYADDALIFQNNWHVSQSPVEVKNNHIEMIQNLSDYGFKKEDITTEQIIDDKGRTWVNFWGLWKGTLKKNQKTIEVPVHISFQFVNGRIVREYGFWNMSNYNDEISAIENQETQDHTGS